MRQQEQINERPPTTNPGPAGGDTGNTEQLHQEGRNVLAASRDIINAALSGDSEAFLAANRQTSGQ